MSKLDKAVSKDIENYDKSKLANVESTPDDFQTVSSSGANFRNNNCRSSEPQN